MEVWPVQFLELAGFDLVDVEGYDEFVEAARAQQVVPIRVVLRQGYRDLLTISLGEDSSCPAAASRRSRLRGQLAIAFSVGGTISKHT